MPSYLALIHKDPSSDWGVSFPDLPGCVTAGRTREEACAMAAEALALHLAGLAADGVPAPVPSAATAPPELADDALIDAVLVHAV